MNSVRVCSSESSSPYVCFTCHRWMLYNVHQKGGETSTNSIASIFAWTRGLAHRGKLDGNAALSGFALTVEEACVETVEGGKMTKDLALLLHGPKAARSTYLNTEEFIDAVKERVEEKLGAASKL